MACPSNDGNGRPQPEGDDERIASLLAVVRAVIDERPLSAIAVPFAMQGNPEGERVVAASDFALAAFIPASDPSYDKRRGVFLATGKLGLILSAGVMAGQAIGNSRRRRAAQAASAPRWVTGESGGLFISQFGFYLMSSSGIHFWGWGALDYISIIAPGEIELLGRTDDGQVRWKLRSQIAELVFFLWAIVRAPHHPQLSTPRWHIDPVSRGAIARISSMPATDPRSDPHIY